MTRDEVVLGPDGLIHKTTIALLHREISLNSCSARHSPKPAISQMPWYNKKKKIQCLRTKALQSFLKKSLRSKVVLFESDTRRVRWTPTAFSSP